MILHQISPRTSRFSIRSISSLGTDRLAVALGRRLDDGYHYFRRATPGGGAEIDTIVVGPGGTWTIQRAGFNGRFRKRNGHWYRWNRSTESWIPWDARPVNESRLAGHRLELYLERASQPCVVEACLLPESGMEVSWERDQAPGIHVEADLERLATRIARDEVLTPAQVDRIVALLDPRQPLPRLATSSPHG